MELFRALGALLDAPCSENRSLGHLLELGQVPDEPTHNDLFLFQLYPYASAFLGEDGRLGGEARDRVAGFWRALGAEPPPEPDHLRTLLAAYAWLAEAQSKSQGRAAQAWRDARHAFLWEPPALVGPPLPRKAAAHRAPVLPGMGRHARSRSLAGVRASRPADAASARPAGGGPGARPP